MQNNQVVKSKITVFFTEPLSAQTLGFFRICVAVFCLVQLLVLLPDWLWLYGPDGLIPWQLSDAVSFRNTPGLSGLTRLLQPLGAGPVQVLWLITMLYFFSLIMLIIGWKSQWMGAIAWITHLLLNTTGHFTAYGVETFTHIALFYCMVVPVGAAWSLDARKGFTVAPHLLTLSIRVIQLHLCIMYLASGLEKAMGTQWWDGNAIWIALQQDQFHHFNVDWMASFPIIPQMLCIGTLVVETLFPAGMLWNKTRKFWLPAILLMHLGIALFLGLQLFGALMFLLNLSIFGTDSLRRLFSRFTYMKNHIPSPVPAH